MTIANPEDVIELRVDDIAQLFHTLDPFPFRERALDKEAEEYIVGWARELAADQLIKIVIHFPDTEAQTKVARELNEAFSRYFSDRAGVLQRDLNELFRVGRRSLGIGVPILIACLVSAHLAAGYLIETPFNRMAEESFLILGWVANWRPLEIFLYDCIAPGKRKARHLEAPGFSARILPLSESKALAVGNSGAVFSHQHWNPTPEKRHPIVNNWR